MKEKFARAGEGKENKIVFALAGKKPAIDVSVEGQENKQAKLDEEEEEPLLVENKKRFVLFPIKYHEVCGVWVVGVDGRSGRCIRRQRRRSGLPRRSISPRISTIGNTA
jgi:hypothetical protein